jgi:chemotaxis-related protein WspB
MLFVVFKAGDTSYAMEACQVIEVVPLVTLRNCPGAPAFMAGMANYGGTSVPVIDLGRTVSGVPSASYLSTRIILTQYAGAGGRRRIVGVLAEAVTSTMEREESDFSQDSVATPGSLCFGKLAVSGTGFIQLVVAAHLAPEELEQMLFTEQEASAS